MLKTWTVLHENPRQEPQIQSSNVTLYDDKNAVKVSHDPNLNCLYSLSTHLLHKYVTLYPTFLETNVCKNQPNNYSFI